MSNERPTSTTEVWTTIVEGEEVIALEVGRASVRIQNAEGMTRVVKLRQCGPFNRRRSDFTL